MRTLTASFLASAAALVAGAAALLQPLPAAAAESGYATAVQEARSLVREGLAGRSEAAPQAARALEAGTGQTQSEVLRALRRTPPDLVEADKRLAAVAAALDRKGDAGDAAGVRAQVHSVLAQPRYQSLRAGDSLWDRFKNWVVTTLLSWLLQVTFGAVPAWLWLIVLGVAVLASALVAIAIIRASWSRSKAASIPTQAGAGPRAGAADHFAQADRAAARGDHTTAVRHLVAGVATAVSGKPFWESSPLTVRELFRQSGRLNQLRPLLTEFERAIYGGLRVQRDDYQRLTEIAAPFRRYSEQERAA